jgi:5-methylcytosine-specific restriction endonuclease McrA
MATQYESLLKTPQWIGKRRQILARDRNKCRSCGKEKELEVHHRQYHFIQQIGQMQLPWKYENRHLITLCHGCHSLGHNKYKIPTFNI